MLSARVEGLPQLRAALFALRAGMHAGSVEGQQGTTEAVVAQWKAGAPVDTGRYKREISGGLEGAESPTEYGPFIEFGTSTHVPQPAGSEAAARVEKQMPGIVALTVKRRLPK